MSRIREAVALTAVMVGGTLGLVELDNSQTATKLDRVDRCYQLAQPAVRSCVSEASGSYGAQGTVLGFLEAAGVLGSVLAGGALIREVRGVTPRQEPQE